MSGLPWLRLYTRTVDNEKLRLLAFEDRWHYIAILCLKGEGIIDEKSPLRDRKIAVKLGLSLGELDAVKKRLSEVELIDQNFQPTGWEEHQFNSDTSTDRVRKYRERKKNSGGNAPGNAPGNVTCNVSSNVSETLAKRKSNALDTDTDTEGDISLTNKTSLSEKKSPSKETSSSKLDALPLFPKNGEEVESHKPVPWDKDTLVGKARKVINALNLKTGRNFQTSINGGKPTAGEKLVIDRIKDGAGIRDFMAVINHRCEKWLHDEKMRDNLRPMTLFTKAKFEDYLGLAKSDWKGWPQ